MYHSKLRRVFGPTVRLTGGYERQSWSLIVRPLNCRLLLSSDEGNRRKGDFVPYLGRRESSRIVPRVKSETGTKA